MKNLFKILLTAAALVLTFASCSEHLNSENDDFANNWKGQNTAAFAEHMKQAKAAIATAKAQYGSDWEAHCNYRIYRYFGYTDNTKASINDSICVEIVKQGTGSGCPLYTDSVSMNYMVRLIPSANYPAGKLIDHSGQTINEEDIFSTTHSAPRHFLVSAQISGMQTALQHMHIGDCWRIYIPSDLAYGSNNLLGSSGIPAYSMLRFDVELKAYARVGTKL